VLQHYAEVLLIFHELEHVDYEIVSAGVGHYALHLPHLVPPKLAQIVVCVRPGFAPELEVPIVSCRFVVDSKLHRSKGLAAASGNGVTFKYKTLIERR
jgi:hypothetical protein